MRRLVLVLLAVALAGVWPLYRAVASDSFTAVIGAGVAGPSTSLLAREVPGLVATNNSGHDGQQFYAIARHPFDPEASANFLDTPAYRYRRILVPALGWLLAPSGGTRLIAALMIIGLAGVALGAASASMLPGAPWWLPLVVGLTPGVVASTGLTLADPVALGFTLAAFAASTRRRRGLVVLALVLGTLTRETVFLAALALALTPGLSARWRAGYVLGPAVALGGWTIWVADRLGGSVNDGARDQFSFPFVGWWRTDSDTIGLVIGLLVAMLLVVGIARTRDTITVCSYLVLMLVLFAMLSTDVTTSWINTTRVVIAGVPLAVWGFAREPA